MMGRCGSQLIRHHLEWLGHVARMTDSRLPWVCLFGWLPPFHGLNRRWRDALKSDLLSLGISDGCWYDKARDRKQWRKLYLQWILLPTISSYTTMLQSVRDILKVRVVKLFTSALQKKKTCGKKFGAIQCHRRNCWFKSRGGLAMHKCKTTDDCSQTNTNPERPNLCDNCSRYFSRPGDLKRHKCSTSEH